MMLTENPNVTYQEIYLYCDRNGVLDTASFVPPDMLPVVKASWLRLKVATEGLALRSTDGSAWIVPGVPEAGEDSDAALDAVWAFRERLIAALQRPISTRSNAP